MFVGGGGREGNVILYFLKPKLSAILKTDYFGWVFRLNSPTKRKRKLEGERFAREN